MSDNNSKSEIKDYHIVLVVLLSIGISSFIWFILPNEDDAVINESLVLIYTHPHDVSMMIQIDLNTTNIDLYHPPATIFYDGVDWEYHSTEVTKIVIEDELNE